jgi:hypothetical protein
MYKVNPIKSIEDFLKQNNPYVAPQVSLISEDVREEKFKILKEGKLCKKDKESEIMIFENDYRFSNLLLHTEQILKFFKKNNWIPGTHEDLLDFLNRNQNTWNEYSCISALGTIFEHIDGKGVLSAGYHPTEGKYLTSNPFDMGWLASTEQYKRGFIYKIKN